MTTELISPDSEEFGALFRGFAHSARIEYATWRHTYHRSGGAGGKQISIVDLEAQANRIRGFQPAMVIGLLQTPAYTRELLSLPGSPLAYAESAAALDEVVAHRRTTPDRTRRGRAIRQLLRPPARRSRHGLGRGSSDPPGRRRTSRPPTQHQMTLTRRHEPSTMMDAPALRDPVAQMTVIESDTCPMIARLNDDPEVLHMVVTPETDPAKIAAFASRIGPGELLVTFPTALLPELT